jgi:Uma2 family endonuclease
MPMSAVVVSDQVRIPSWVKDLSAFRRWARSEAYPERGWVSYLNGEVWVDTHMEQLFTHNRVKTCYTVTVGGLVEAEERGYYFSDRCLLSHKGANLCTEPDGTFCSWASISQGQIRLVEGEEEGFVELEGTADMALEVVSAYSVRKDKSILRDLYWQAKVPEYWLVDVRKPPIQFDILRWRYRGYSAVRAKQGWLRSRVLDHSFLLEAEADRLGNPRYMLRVD